MKTVLIVDGYNVLHHWAEKKQIEELDLEAGREHLIHRLADYSGYRGCRTILVFDAYAQEEAENRELTRNGISIVFTGKDQTADSYIERKVYDLRGHTQEKRRYNGTQVQVVTSDYTVQQMILACGAQRMSSRELLDEMEQARIDSEKQRRVQQMSAGQNRISDHMDDTVRDELENMRRGQ